MENNYISYLKTDDNRIINENCIRWVRKMDNCLEVCMRSDGCIFSRTHHEICKFKSFESYNKLNKHFE